LKIAPTLRDEVETLICSRRALKGVVTKTRTAIEEAIASHGPGTDPGRLEQRIEMWSQKLAKLQAVDQDIMCHPEGDEADYDTEVLVQEIAYGNAKSDIINLRRDYEKSLEEPMVAAVPQPANGRSLPKLDIKKPPVLEENTDHRAFLRWKPLWYNYARLVDMEHHSREVQVGLFWECCSSGFLRIVNNSVGIKTDTNRPLNEV
jgi:hypothetical protein